MFKGSYVAIVTPFKDGKIDEKKFKELVEFQIKNGTDGIVPAGCTGEAATLTHEEQKSLMKLACEIVNKRVPVVAGAGSNSKRVTTGPGEIATTEPLIAKSASARSRIRASSSSSAFEIPASETVGCFSRLAGGTST